MNRWAGCRWIGALLVLVVLVGSVVGGLAQVVHFPDSTLRAIVRTTLDIPFTEDITVACMQELHTLVAVDHGIVELQGLEYAVNARSLWLGANEISDLSPLAGLPQLEWLELHDNAISDLSPLAGLPQLERLELAENAISDLSPLAGLTELEVLILSVNHISDMSPLEGLTNLEILYLDGNQISDMSPLEGLTNLTQLFLSGNEVSDLGPLAGLTNLTVLGLGINEISDLGPLAGLTNLTVLWLSGNELSDLSPLAGLTNLTWLKLDNNQISDISALVANSDAGGLGNGDLVVLRHNYLDLTEGSQAMTDIQTLIDRGVNVEYEPQLEDDRLEVTLSYSPAEPTTEDTIEFATQVTAPDELGEDALTYNWFVNDEPTGESGPSFTWDTPPEGEHTVQVVVSDDEGRQAEDSVTFTVEEAFSVKLSWSPWRPTTEYSIYFTAEVTAPDDAVLTYDWFLNGQPTGATGPSFTQEPLPEGEHTMRVRVFDDKRGRDVEDIVAFYVAPPFEERYERSRQRSGDSWGEPSGVGFSDLLGEVYVIPYDDPEDFYFAELGVELRVGDVIDVRGNSGAILSLLDMTTFVIRENSMIIIEDQAEEQSRLGLFFGTFLTNFKQILEDGTMDIEMSQAVAGIRGTIFVAHEDGETSGLKVFQGSVDFTHFPDGEMVTVGSGQQAQATAEGISPLSEFCFEEELSVWPEEVRDQIRADLEKPVESTVGPGWTLLGLPVDPEKANPDALEIDPEPAFSYLYRWDPGTRRYLAAHRDEITELEELHGYWLFLSREHTVYEVCVEGTALTGEQHVQLGPRGWQMIGVPYPVAWGDADGGSMRFRNNTEEKTLAEAITAGWVLNTIYAWDSTEGAWIRYRATDGETLEPWTGYFLYTLQDDLELIFSEEQVAWPAGFALSVAAQAFDPGEPPLPVLPVELPAHGLDALAFPNPVSDGGGVTFTVRGPAARWVEAISVRVHDLSGRIVHQGEGDGGSLLWDTMGGTGVPVASGVYLYTVQAKLDGEWVSAAVEKLLILR